jgi:hypothetical protein
MWHEKRVWQAKCYVCDKKSEHLDRQELPPGWSEIPMFRGELLYCPNCETEYKRQVEIRETCERIANDPQEPDTFCQDFPALTRHVMREAADQV